VVHHDEPLTAERVRPLLEGRFGDPYLWSASCSSTQDALRGTELPDGAIAVSEHQTAGRGREGRAWDDVPSRSLLFSLLLRPPPGSAAPQLSLVAGLAVAEAVEESRDAAGIKWPNDVLLGGRKVAGVLLEASEGVVVCGIGVNVMQTEEELPTDTPVPAGSLATVLGRAPDRAGLLASLLEILEHRYDAWCRSGLAPLLDELEARNVLRGRHVRIGGETGTAGRIAPDGRLTLNRKDGTTVLVGSGEVEAEQVSD
jgi:BirA family transcriptional regulator, biotin operon repressor / biotin---[acetyl-CoA-carboxylase] ligase